MIPITFKQPRTSKWKEWRKKCDVEQLSLNLIYSAGKSGKVSAELYRQQKDVYFSLSGPFRGKCAYCETLIVANHPGDLDHFRPKNRVTNSLGAIKIKDRHGREIPHPGYYWLAYDFQNLLPSCEDCNRPNKGRSGGLRVGKWDEFPVKGFRARKPGEEKRERPLLLNPTARGIKIEQHLTVNELGIMEHRSLQGKTCCDIFGLNVRQGLVQERMEVYRRGYDAILNYLVAVGNNNDVGAKNHLKTINGYEAGIRPYSAAGRAGLKAMYKQINKGIYRLVSKRSSKKCKP